MPGLFDRSVSFCLGVTEPGTGSDVAAMTTACRDGADFVVSGAEKWISGASWASHMTTAVRTGGPGSGGISVLVVPLDVPGVAVEHMRNSGQHAGGASLVLLDEVRVPDDHLVGAENGSFGILMRNFNHERFILAVHCNRKSRTCLALAFAYAALYRAFGRPMLASQVIRRKLAELAHRVEGHWAWLEQVAFHAGVQARGRKSPDLAARIALLKVQGGQMVELAAREAQQIFGGGAGYQGGGPGVTVEQISRDLRMLVVGGGSEEVISDLAVRQEMARTRM